MPWWSWILIWTGLVIALLALLALFAVILFRKLVRMGDELSTLMAKADLLQRAAQDAAAAGVPPSYEIAVLADASGLRAERDRKRGDRRVSRAISRLRRIDRGKLLTRAEVAPLTNRTPPNAQ